MMVKVRKLEKITAQGWEAQVERENGSIRLYAFFPDMITMFDDPYWVKVSGRGLKLSDLKTDKGRKKRIESYFARM